MRPCLLTPSLAICACLFSAAAITGCKAAPAAENSATDSQDTAALPQLVFNDADLIARGDRVVWRVDLALPAGTHLAHVTHLDDKIVTMEHPNNLVSVFDAASGTRLWSKAIGDPLGQTFEPIRIGDSLFIANETQLYEYNITTGRERIRLKLPYPATTKPLESGKNLIFGGSNGDVWAQRIDTAGIEWTYRMGSKITGDPVLVDGGRVIVGDAAGNIVLINENGIKTWATRTHNAVMSPVAVAGLAVYAPSTDQAMYGLLLSSGHDMWPAYRATVALDQAPLADGSGVYLPVPGQKLVAINAVDGNVRWTLEEAARPVADDADRLLAISEQSLVLLDKENGRVIGRIASEQLKDVFVLKSRHILAASESGHLAMVALR